MGTTFCLLDNNEDIYAHMSRSPLGCVGTLVHLLCILEALGA